ncbi:MAG: prepilin-type N-terminal cleavage/methylation domain-containing protein [Acidimicrobiia bacterium]
MSARARVRARDESGFTLPELLMAIAILAIIVAPLTMSFITGLRVVGKVDQKFNDSRSGLISAADWSNDVANATQIVLGATGACGSGGTTIVSFKFPDASTATANPWDTTVTTTPVNSVVSYAYDSGSKKLLRRSCINGGSASQSVPAVSLDAQPTVACFNADASANASCTTDPQTQPATKFVRLSVTSAQNSPSPADPNPTKYSYVLEGTRRPL